MGISRVIPHLLTILSIHLSSRSVVCLSDQIQHPAKVIIPDLGRIKWYQSHFGSFVFFHLSSSHLSTFFFSYFLDSGCSFPHMWLPVIKKKVLAWITPEEKSMGSGGRETLLAEEKLSLRTVKADPYQKSLHLSLSFLFPTKVCFGFWLLNFDCLSSFEPVERTLSDHLKIVS